MAKYNQLTPLPFKGLNKMSEQLPAIQWLSLRELLSVMRESCHTFETTFAVKVKYITHMPFTHTHTVVLKTCDRNELNVLSLSLLLV